MIAHLDRDQMITRSHSLKCAFEFLLILAVDKGMHVIALRPLFQSLGQFNS